MRAAIARAARNIRSVSRRQVPKGWRHTVAPGITVEQRVVPLARVGCYVPAGRYPLPSSLLMTAIPARAAGVAEVVVCCPRPDAAVFAAALEAGVDRLFRIGGAHAIAALAYGTRTVPRVDKIVGPGNRWVSAAKSLVVGRLRHRLLRRPDRDPDRHRHRTGAMDRRRSDRAGRARSRRARGVDHDEPRGWRSASPPRSSGRCRPPGRRGDRSRGTAASSCAATMTEAIALANDAAAEHVVAGTEALARRVTNAGAVFVGAWTAQVAGDYAIGSNHVLPTAGAARFRGGLNAADFVKLVSVQRVTKRGLKRIAQDDHDAGARRGPRGPRALD